MSPTARSLPSNCRYQRMVPAESKARAMRALPPIWTAVRVSPGPAAPIGEMVTRRRTSGSGPVAKERVSEPDVPDGPTASITLRYLASARSPRVTMVSIPTVTPTYGVESTGRFSPRYTTRADSACSAEKLITAESALFGLDETAADTNRGADAGAAGGAATSSPPHAGEARTAATSHSTGKKRPLRQFT